MHAMQLSVEHLRMSAFLVKMYLDDLSDAEFLIPPAPGCNPVAWQMGHLIVSQNSIIGKLKPGSGIVLPEGFEKRHSKEGAADHEAPGYLTKAEYLGLFDQVMEAAQGFVLGLTEADLDQPCPPGLPPMFPTVASVVVLLASHPLMHAGQFVPLRRKLGKPIKI